MEELELTYLVKELPGDLKDVRSKDILDIYIPASAEHPTLRIRKAGDRYEITKKEPVVGGDASRQLETTIPLSAAEYGDLCRLEGKRVQKTRYYYHADGVDYEIGIFGGGLAGLVLVDVELDSLEKKNAFVPPAWCLADVTQEKFLAGGMLCGKRYADIEEPLGRFGYKKLKII